MVFTLWKIKVVSFIERIHRYKGADENGEASLSLAHANTGQEPG